MVAMNAFMMRYRESFCPDLDLTFMDYFLELSKRENRGQFIVHHEKLFEYGITIDAQSSRAKEKVDVLKFVKDVDYRLTKVREPVKQGGVVTKNVYHFTPLAFKKILLAARPHARHEINVDRYRDYYLFLEEVVGYYNEYQQLHKDRRNAMLTSENVNLSEQVSNLTEQIGNLTTQHEQQMAEQTRNVAEQKAQIAQLLGYAQSTTNTLDDVKDELTDTKNILIETQEEVTTAKSYLEDKSYHSTKNPSNENLHHYFAATKYVKKCGDEVAKFVTGQRKYVINTMNKYVEEDNHKIAVPPFYNANGVDLRQNAQEAFKLKRREVVKAYNDRVAADAKAFNTELLKEIRAHNKLHPDNIRIYELEKLKPKKITVGAITVKFAKLQFTYTQNEYMSFDEVLKVILDTNRSTQSSPMDSSDSEEE